MTTHTQEREQRLMAMGEMATTLAHEIRNPLGSMELFCTLLKKQLSDPQAQLNSTDTLKIAEQIHLGIRTLDRIIANCLQFAREVIPQRKSLTDVRLFMEEILDYARPKAVEVGVALELNLLGSVPVEVDPYLLKQALLNVLINAIEAYEVDDVRHATDGRHAQVTITSDLTNTCHWKISIADNGMGVSTDTIAKIFDPFFTTKSRGTGLGLAITHAIIRAHQGNIFFDSVSGKGTTVTIILPQAAAKPAPPCSPRHQQALSGAS